MPRLSGPNRDPVEKVLGAFVHNLKQSIKL